MQKKKTLRDRGETAVIFKFNIVENVRFDNDIPRG